MKEMGYEENCFCMIAAALVFSAVAAGAVCWQMVGDVTAPVPGQVRGPRPVGHSSSPASSHLPAATQHGTGDQGAGDNRVIPT